MGPWHALRHTTLLVDSGGVWPAPSSFSATPHTAFAAVAAALYAPTSSMPSSSPIMRPPARHPRHGDRSLEMPRRPCQLHSPRPVCARPRSHVPGRHFLPWRPPSLTGMEGPTAHR